jgi:ribose transport system permease protein
MLNQAVDSRSEWGTVKGALQKFAKNPPAMVAACATVLLLAASTVHTNFLVPTYLLQQLQIAAFVGVVAAGLMAVILLGHIDLSVPWTITTGAMMAAAAGSALGPGWAIPAGLACGMLIGLVNGLGVAVLRIPSMIFTLGVNAVLQGLMVLYTGGHAPQDAATGLMRTLAVGRTFEIPNAILVWAAASVAILFVLNRTAAGRYIYVVGNTERAAYLSGVRTNRVIVGEGHVTLVWGRDYGDVAPVGGIILGGHDHVIDVGVDVIPAEE